MKVTSKKAASFLRKANDILILSHQNPDGDTLGAAFALYYGLKQLGKRARIECADGIPERFRFGGLPEFESFEPQCIVAVDIAALQLLGKGMQKYADRIDLCIDHHPTNTGYAKKLLLNSQAGATCEIMYELFLLMKLEITPMIANYLYMGIATDTGCFKFSNTTAQTHYAAAGLIGLGADYIRINVRFFETKSKSRILVERQALDSIRFYFQERCAMFVVSKKMIEETQADESELDGISAIPRQIEGVEIGITMREKENGRYKVSMRSGESIDVSKICAMLGGGGHMRASGCVVEGQLEEAVKKVLHAVADYTGWDGVMV